MKRSLSLVAGIAITVIVLFSGCYGDMNVKYKEYDFVNDESILGQWISVDFVDDIKDFNPGTRVFNEELLLKNMTFLDDGELQVNDNTDRPWYFWTKGIVTHSGDETASRYIIKEIDGDEYLFFQWKLSELEATGEDSLYYVLKRN